MDFRGISEELHKYTVDRRQKYGRVYGGIGIIDRFLIVNEPELLKEILVKQFIVYPHHFPFNVGPKPYLDKLLPFMRGDDNWKRIRSILTPAFTSGRLKSMVTLISNLSEKFVLKLDQFKNTGKASMLNFIICLKT